MTKVEKLKQLEIKKQFLSKQVDLLVKMKKKLYGKIDISEPMSKEEKSLTHKIAMIFSEINSIILEKRKLR